jgi:hypothetical protein
MASSFPGFAELSKGRKRTFVMMDVALAFMHRACKTYFESEKDDSEYVSWLQNVLGLDEENRLNFCQRNQPICLKVLKRFTESQHVLEGHNKASKLALAFISQVSLAISEDLHRKKFRRTARKVAIGSKKYLFWTFIGDQFESRKWLKYFQEVLFTESFEFLYGEPIPEDEFISDEPFPENRLASNPIANLLAQVSTLAKQDSIVEEISEERLEIILSIWGSDPANVAFTINPGIDYLIDIFLMTRWPDVSADSIRDWLGGAEPSDAISKYLEV